MLPPFPPPTSIKELFGQMPCGPAYFFIPHFRGRTCALTYLALRIKVSWSTFQRQGQKSGCSPSRKNKEFKPKTLVLNLALRNLCKLYILSMRFLENIYINLYEEYIRYIYKGMTICIILGYCKGWMEGEKTCKVWIIYLLIHLRFQENFMESLFCARVAMIELKSLTLR